MRLQREIAEDFTEIARKHIEDKRPAVSVIKRGLKNKPDMGVKKILTIKTQAEAEAFQKFQVKEQARHWRDITNIQTDLFKLYRKFPDLPMVHWAEVDPDEFYVVEEDDATV